MIKFTNTGQNKQLRFFVIFLFILLTTESAVGIFIANILLENTAIFFAITVAITIFITLIICSSVSLLMSAHKLTDDYLIIKLGRRFKGKKIFFNNIISIEETHNSNQPKTDSLGIVDKRKDDTFYCLGSSKNQYLLQLRDPILIKAKDNQGSGKQGYVTCVCINIDDKNLFEEKMSKFFVITKDEAKSNENTNLKISNTQNSDNIKQLSKQIEYSIHPIKISSDSIPVLEIKNLFYAYNNYIAINNLNLCVEKGTICAFLGHNGAGKSTTLKCLQVY